MSARYALTAGRTGRQMKGSATAEPANYRGERPVLLWFNGTTQTCASQLACRASQWFDVAESLACVDLLPSEIERIGPKILVFDFDYPDRKRLRAMQQVKRMFADMLMLMFTTAHSEALAVWAFRARVWNYLVKPVLAEELDLNLQRLAEIASASRATAPSVLPPDQEVPEDVPAETPRCTRQTLLPAIHFVKRHYNKKLRIEEVAAICGMSSGTFSRTFRSTFGMSFKEYIANHRIGEARRMLRRPRASITDVAYATGFSDHSYFDRVFKAHVGVTPSEYARGMGQHED